jgi:hypothetical protein
MRRSSEIASKRTTSQGVNDMDSEGSFGLNVKLLGGDASQWFGREHKPR